jgi:hypothetical protein
VGPGRFFRGHIRAERAACGATLIAWQHDV